MIISKMKDKLCQWFFRCFSAVSNYVSNELLKHINNYFSDVKKLLALGNCREKERNIPNEHGFRVPIPVIEGES